MKLYFLRHGIAQDHAPGLADADRPLVPEGIDKIERFAKRMSDFDINLTVIYSSPLLRAKQTAEIVAKYHGIHMVLRDSLAFDFDARALQTIVDEHVEGDEIMLVGHEPTFSSMISYVIGGGNITVKKGGLARIDLFSQHPLHGTLVYLINPKLL